MDEAWKRDDGTRAFVRKLKEDLRKAHENLVSAARLSTDPDVRDRAARYEMIFKYLRTLDQRTDDQGS